MRTTTLLLLAACGPPSAADIASTEGSEVDFFFNDPGSRLENVWSPDSVDVMSDLIGQAGSTIDLAVMGFTHDQVIDALVSADDRGVKIRMVGDAGHLTNSGYDTFRDEHIPLVAGNGQHIMHDKFMVLDDRLVFGGTANWSNSDLEQNVNNSFVIDSPPIAADFKAEHQQMFDGLFGANKVTIDNGRVYEVGDTTVEVWFSPNEDAMGRLLELVGAAQESVRFTIFAFTKDQLGSALIEKQAEFDLANAADGLDPTADFHDLRSVAGVIDQSQLHSNGQYHEIYRLLGAGIPVRMDGNDATTLPGDYQAGGGRLHAKTMMIDADGEEPVVVTGSFNWSASATQSNDEFMVVFHGPRGAQLYDTYFDNLYSEGRQLGGDRIGDDTGLKAGDVVVSEVMWYGVTDTDIDGFDEFLELENRTDRRIDIDLWQIVNSDDVVIGFPPGSFIPPNGTFTVVDHTLEPYVDGQPQDETTAYASGDLVLNPFNDNRQSRLYLKDTALELILQDPDANVIDHAGNGGPPFAGGPEAAGVRSMERIPGTTDGMVPASWRACPLSEGVGLVNPDYQSVIFASPDVANTP